MTVTFHTLTARAAHFDKMSKYAQVPYLFLLLNGRKIEIRVSFYYKEAKQVKLEAGYCYFDPVKYIYLRNSKQYFSCFIIYNFGLSSYSFIY